MENWCAKTREGMMDKSQKGRHEKEMAQPHASNLVVRELRVHRHRAMASITQHVAALLPYYQTLGQMQSSI